jgi:hypothetical protein
VALSSLRSDLALTKSVRRQGYFDYYRDYHAFCKLHGMDLPDEVLKKVYYKNALRVTPGLPQTGGPE